MKLYEIGEQELIHIIAKKGENTLEYSAAVEMNMKNILFIEPIMHEGAIVNFDVEDVEIDVLYLGDHDVPLAWNGVKMQIIEYGEKKYHALYTTRDSRKMNRRENYRQYVGIGGTMMIKGTRRSLSVIVKDVSHNGIAVVINDMSMHVEDIGDFQVNFQDKDCRLSVGIDAVAMREIDVEEDKRVIGARVKSCNINLNEYIARKQKIEMAKRRGK